MDRRFRYDGRGGTATTILNAHFDGKVFVPDEPVHLEAGQPAMVVVETPERPIHPAGKAAEGPADDYPPMLDLLEELDQLPSNPYSPGDRSIHHDHYLYGTPKRS